MAKPKDKAARAQKLARREAAGVGAASRSARAARPARGFRAGWGWGASAIGIALRRPLFTLVGWALLVLAVGLAAALPWGPALMALPIVSGVACAGAAARAAKATARGARSPWRAWIEPWSGKARAWRHALQAALGLAALMGIAAGLQSLQAAIGSAPSPMGWMSDPRQAAVMAFLLCALLAWLMMAAAPAGSARSAGRLLFKTLTNSGAMFGFAVFWFVWIAASDIALVVLARKVFEWGQGGPVDGAVVASISVACSILSVGLASPLMAMAAGIGAGALAPAAIPARGPEPEPEPASPADPVGAEPVAAPAPGPGAALASESPAEPSAGGAALEPPAPSPS